MQVNGLHSAKVNVSIRMVGWLQKLSHVGPVSYEDFYSSLKSTITRDEYKQFFKLFKENDCTTMGDRLRIYNPDNTILIKLMCAKTQLVSQIYQ